LIASKRISISGKHRNVFLAEIKLVYLMYYIRKQFYKSHIIVHGLANKIGIF